MDGKYISTGADFLDGFFQGGYEKDIITTIYGPSGSGKTNLCLLPAISLAKNGKKVIYVDTEGGLAPERIKQINSEERILGNILFFHPTNFEEQKEVFKRLKEIINQKISLVVVDTISMLYRLELSKGSEINTVNSCLGEQISYLSEISRKYFIPVILTNQVYSSFDDKEIKIVGGDLLKYSSKCLIELRTEKNYRRLVLRKHRFLPEGESLCFRIVEKGIELVNKI